MAGRQINSRLLSKLQPRSAWGAWGGQAAGALQLVAWFSTSSCGGVSPPPVDITEVAKALRAQQFVQDLKQLRSQHSALPYSEVLQFMRQRGFTEAAAEDVLDRLERSGALLTLQGIVLLRPGEVAEALSLALSSSTGMTQQRLAAAQQELQQLEEQQADVARRAAWRRKGLVWGALGSQLALYGSLAYCTFVELSWDVMEPICYFVGGGQTLACYLYFMHTSKEFGWDTALERHVGQWEVQQLRHVGFDVHRYRQLKAEVRRLSDLLHAQQRRLQQPPGESSSAPRKHA